MVSIWASLAGVPCLAIYCAVYIFLGAPLAAAIMFAYMAIVGVVFMGLQLMHTRKSGLIFGVGEDAAHVTGVIAKQLGAT